MKRDAKAGEEVDVDAAIAKLEAQQEAREQVGTMEKMGK